MVHVEYLLALKQTILLYIHAVKLKPQRQTEISERS